MFLNRTIQLGLFLRLQNILEFDFFKCKKELDSTMEQNIITMKNYEIVTKSVDLFVEQISDSFKINLLKDGALKNYKMIIF